MPLESDGRRFRLWERTWFPFADARALRRLDRLAAAGAMPRIALVKQDCNEDLYCCPSDAPVPEMLRSTLLRPGPVALFTRFPARFLLLETEADPECSIWKEKPRDLGWCTEPWFRSFRDRVPGRDHGQSRFAVSVDDVDWSDFDVVVSIDVAVPARITRQYPGVVWAYYVREVKAPSYGASLRAPLPGQDLFLKQSFGPRFQDDAPHVVSFPYHFHYHGVFADAFPDEPSLRLRDDERRGIFLEHHTHEALSDNQLRALAAFGPVFGTGRSEPAFDAIADKAVPVTTMEPEVMSALHAARYFVKIGGRIVYGTAMVEAIAAGAVAVGNPEVTAHNFLYGRELSVDSFDTLVACLRRLEAAPERLAKARARQRALVDYLCFRRPATELIEAAARVRRHRQHSKEQAIP